MFRSHLLSTLLILLPLLGCGGGGSSTATATYGTLSLKLGSDSTPVYSKVCVSLQKVEYKPSSASSWTTLAEVAASYDLRSLQNGAPATLVTARSLATGTYAFRLTWASENFGEPAKYPGYLLVTGSTTEQRLALPSTTTVSGTVSISQDTLTTAEIVLTGNQTAQYHASLSVPYVFQATAQVVDLGSCGRIVGTASCGSTLLEGAEVLAQTVDGSGTATVVRRAITDSSGQFILEGLPTGRTYYIASQPYTSGLGYAAASTSPVTLSNAADYSASLSFSTGALPGALAVYITPISTSSQGTWVELRETLATGSSGYRTLVTRSQTVSTGSSQDTTSFPGLYPASYGVMIQRSTSGGDASASVGSEETVTEGATTSTTVTYSN